MTDKKKTFADLMGVTAYAEHRGVHLKTVQEACARGKIPFENIRGRRMIDPEKADKAWARNTGTGKNNGPYDKAKKDELNVGEDNPNVPSVYVQDAYIKAYKARLAKLDYEEKSKKLISKEVVKNQVVTAVRLAKEAILQIPQKIAPEVAAETDPQKCELLMYKQLEEILIELAELTKRYR